MNGSIKVGIPPLIVACCLSLWMPTLAGADLPIPVLNTVFPAGAQAGKTVTVTVEGNHLDQLRDLRLTAPGLRTNKIEANRFTLAIPRDTAPGVYDLRVVGLYGMSPPRAFVVSNRAEQREVEPNDTLNSAQHVPLDAVLNGRIEKPGDVDCYRFPARNGQRIVLDCWARRLDSQLRAVLEVYDAAGRRLAVNRGYVGIDPLIDFLAPADGIYRVKVFDLSFLGSSAHFYRLELDTKPRVEFALPCVVQRGKSVPVKLFGRNLSPARPLRKEWRVKSGAPVRSTLRPPPSTALDCVEVRINAPADAAELLPLPLSPAQLAVDAFPYWYPGSHTPVAIGLTDVPVALARGDNLAPKYAQQLAVPCEVSGQLKDGDERHWYAVQARRGEVFWLEGFGERIGSPIDLAVAVFDALGQQRLLKLPDHRENLGGYRFPTSHSDPAGRWLAPADGRFLIVVRSVVGGLNPDPRRVYRLGIRREDPDFHLAVISRRTDQPAALNVGRGGREMAEVLVIRQRGLEAPIRVIAGKLPAGIQCPDIWIGPGQDRAPLIVTAGRESPAFAGSLRVMGQADIGGRQIRRTARGGTMIWSGQPLPSGRLTQDIPLATGPEATITLTASPATTNVFQGSVVDVEVDIERRFAGPADRMELRGVGLPRFAANAVATIARDKSKGWISFFFPQSLPVGPYTFAVQAETQVPSSSKSGNAGKVGVTLVSNPITVQVEPARIALEVDPRTPRKIGRGKIIQLRFTAERKHGFIGKIHTELAAPGGVVGLRGRGVTLVGQSATGEIQVIATETAPLGRQPFLRLEAVGTLEDQPVYRASRFVELEITK